jgi:hypothetical protein
VDSWSPAAVVSVSPWATVESAEREQAVEISKAAAIEPMRTRFIVTSMFDTRDRKRAGATRPDHVAGTGERELPFRR